MYDKWSIRTSAMQAHGYESYMSSFVTTSGFIYIYCYVSLLLHNQYLMALLNTYNTLNGV